MKKSDREAGLTLIETMIALLILAGVAVSVMALVSQNTRFIAIAEQRLAARVLADNATIRELLRTNPGDRGETSEEISFAGVDWIVTQSIEEAGEGIDQLTVSVRLKTGAQARGQTLATVQTLKAAD